MAGSFQTTAACHVTTSLPTTTTVPPPELPPQYLEYQAYGVLCLLS